MLTYSLTVSVWWVRLYQSVTVHWENSITSSSSKSSIVLNKKSCNSVFDSGQFGIFMFHTFLVLYYHIQLKEIVPDK